MITHQTGYLRSLALAALVAVGSWSGDVAASATTGTLNLDLLVVVDSSPSMRQERKNLASRLSDILRFIPHLNWRIAVTTTDSEDTCVHAVINKGEDNIEGRFREAVTVGTSGSFKERGVLRAVQGLRAECLEEHWVRPTSQVAVLIVSDEDNCSRDSIHCEGEAWASGSYLTSYLDVIKGRGNYRVFGLIWHPLMSQEQCPTGYNHGTTYARLIDETHGLWGSICESDFSSSLTMFSKSMKDLAQ